MKRIVFLTLFSVLLSLFVSSVEASMQERTLRIENRNEWDAHVAYCYIVAVPDPNGGKQLVPEFHVTGWVHVPAGRSKTVRFKTNVGDVIYVADKAKKIGYDKYGKRVISFYTAEEGNYHYVTHPQRDFKVVQDYEGGIRAAYVTEGEILYRVDTKVLDGNMEFFKRTPDLEDPRADFTMAINGKKTLDYDGDYDMRGFIRERHGKDYALLFATNEYQHWDNLSTPIADAEAIGAELKNRYGFFKVDIQPNVTIDQILRALKEYTAVQYDRGDQLFVYFAGHGQFDEGLKDGHIAGTESNIPTVDTTLSTYLSFRQLRGILDDVPCERIMLMLDVCYGGTFDRDIAMGKQPDELRDRGFTTEAPSENRFLMSPQETLAVKTRWYISSGGNEKVIDGLSHSPFAKALLTLLRNRDNRDGVLTVPEIRRQMPTQLESELNKLRGLHPNTTTKQTPAFGPFGSGKAENQVFLLIESK